MQTRNWWRSVSWRVFATICLKWCIRRLQAVYVRLYSDYLHMHMVSLCSIDIFVNRLERAQLYQKRQRQYLWQNIWFFIAITFVWKCRFCSVMFLFFSFCHSAAGEKSISCQAKMSRTKRLHTTTRCHTQTYIHSYSTVCKGMLYSYPPCESHETDDEDNDEDVNDVTPPWKSRSVLYHHRRNTHQRIL